HPRHLDRRRRRRDVGVEPRARGGDQVDGHGPAGAAAELLDRRRYAVRQRLARRPQGAAARGKRIVAAPRGGGPAVAGGGGGERTTRPWSTTRLPRAWSGKATSAMPVTASG